MKAERTANGAEKTHTGVRAGALARAIFRPGAGEPNAAGAPRRRPESLRPAPCEPPAPGQKRPARLQAALTRTAAPARHAAAGLLVIFAALLAVSTAAQAQTVTTLVSNTGQQFNSGAGASVGITGSNHFSQALGFTTGDNADGYTLSSVQLSISQFGGSDAAKISIYSANASGNPDSSLYVLINPAPIVNDSLNTFTAPANATLENETKYFVVAESTADGIFSVGVTASSAEDSGKASGWSINDQRHHRISDAGSWSQPSSANKPRISVMGTLGGTTTTNTPATGKPGISGTAAVGQMLTATTSGISDADGKTNAENGDAGYAYTYQWILVDGSNETDISGEMSSTYTPSSSDVGKTIRVRVSFTDDADNAEGPLESDATAAVTAASSCAELWCATLTVRSLSDGHRGCANSQVALRRCSNTDNLTEDGFSHGGTDYAVTSVQVRSDGELRLFINPNLTTATRSLVLLVDAERFAFAHADTTAANSRYWNSSGLSWTALSTVELKLVEASTVATLSGLEIEDGAGAEVELTPGFAPGTTTYTASVANSVSRITLKETPSDANASVDYLDGDDNPLTDLDTGKPGHQVDLDTGDNVIQVTVTAEDGVATRTYTVTVTRNDTPGNTAPVFEDGTDVTLTVLENTAAGTDVGSPLTATDAENDSLEYTLEGADAASFDIVPGTGQLQTKTGVDYNHEAAKNSYSVTVKADDDNGGTDTIAVTVNVTDVDEKSVRPPRPVVAATPGTTDSLDVSWTKPGLAGGPDIVGYNVRHQVTGSGSWTTVQLTGTGLTTMISGLQAGTGYTVQVQTRNGETPSLWSLEGTGTTTTTTTNTAATGKPGISGTAAVGQTLTATTSGISDADGKTKAENGDSGYAYTYQWVQVDGGTETDISGEMSSTYTPSSSDVGKTIRVKVSFTDDLDNAEGPFTSEQTAAVTAVTVAVSIAADHDRIGAGLEDLVFTLTRQGATTAALDATVTIVQDRSWLGTSDLSHTVTFMAGSATATLTLAATRFSFDPDTSGDLTATVTGAGISGGEATVEMVSTAYAPITVSYDKSSYTFAEDAANVNIYAVATLDPAYPRAPSRSFYNLFNSESGTATFRQDFEPITWAPQFFHEDYELEGNNYVARKRLRHNNGTYFAVVNDDVYEGPEGLVVAIARDASLTSGLLQFAYPDSTTCESHTCPASIEYPVTITDEEDRPVLSLSAAPASISEADDTTTGVAENVSTLTVAAASPKTFATEQTITLTFGGSAVYGDHYGVAPVDADANTTGHQVLLPAETASVQVTVTAVDNATVDGGRTIEVVGSLDGTEFDRASIAVADDERANTAPAFVNGASTDREVAENTAAGTNFDDPVRATDPENDTLEYSLDGTDAASFDIDRGTGQLRTKTGVDYDHEAKSSYSVTVAVNDGYGGTDTIAVTVAVTDEDEPPLAPAAPGVAKVRGSVMSLKVSWRAPDNAGRPAIAHYDLRYRTSRTGTGGWMDGPQDQTGTSAMIENLVENTEYQVQVRAANAEGDGAWSASRSGTPGAEEARRGELRLVNDSDPTVDDEGRLEVFFRGEWGTVCDDRFTSETFTLYGPDNTIQSDDVIVDNIAPQFACQLMGYATGEVVLRGGMSIAPASQRIWLDDVRCAAGSTHWTGSPPTGLQHCYHAGVGLENCTHEEDVHLRCFGSSTARAAFSGEFQNVPESHDGTEFTFQAAFSEAVTASAEDLRDHAFDVTGGTVTEVSLVDGRRDLWSVTVSPVSSGDVTITLEGERACDTPGAVCAEDGAQLTNTVSVEIPGTPVTDDGITARFEDVPPQHDGETPFTLRLALSAPVRNSYTAMREDVLEATGGTVTRARRIDGRSDLWEITITPLGEGNVQIGLAAGRACGTHGALCTRDGRGLATGLMTLVPGPSTIGPRSPGPAPLTARFTNIPGEHDGERAFTLEIVFSEAPSGMKNRTLRNALSVTGGAVTRVRRVNSDRAHRIVTISPAGRDAVDIALPASPDCEAAGAICTEAGGKLETGLLTRVRGPAALRVADAEVHEGPGAVLAFSVTLDRATSAAVSVDYATSDGTAQAGSDYTAATGSVTFAPGETAKTVSVAVLDDSHDEGSETLTLTLTNPSGAYLADGVATGTIENTDAMPQAWIARFGRTVADQVLDAVDARLRAARTAGMSVSLAGQRLGLAAPESGAETVAVSGAAAETDPKPATLFGGTAADAEETARLKALSDWLKQETGENDRPDGWSRSLTGRELLMGSSFSLAAETEGGGFAGLWGRMAQTRFAGREGVLSLDGDVTTGLLGADYASGRWTTGLVVSHSIGEGGYRGEGSGDIEASVTALTPWAGYAVTERLSVWGAAGYGAGELKLTAGDDPALKTDLGMTLAAAGARGTLIDGDGPKLDAVGDARWVRTTTARVSSSASDGGNLASASAAVTRLRLGLAGWWPLALGEGAFGKGATVTPRLALGVRHDGGDAETGFGADIGGGVALAAPAYGLTVSLEGRGVLTHEAAGLRDRGVAGTLAWNPPPPGRGPRLTLTQTLGAGASGGTEALLSRTTLEGLAANDNDNVGGRRRLETRFGYGFGMFEGRFTMTPEIGLGLSDAGRDYSLGWRLTRAGSGAGSLEFTFEARRRESANDDTPPEHGIGFSVTARW